MTDRSQGIAARCAALPGITILFYFTVIPAPFVWQQPTQYELGLLGLLGLVGVTATSSPRRPTCGRGWVRPC
jgi:hypothetical protein